MLPGSEEGVDHNPQGVAVEPGVSENDETALGVSGHSAPLQELTSESGCLKS